MNLRGFAVYYGFGKQEILSKYDLVIVEPEAHTASDLSQLRQKGAVVLSYLSIVEVIPNSKLFKQLDKEDFLTENGKLLFNKYYGNLLADLRSQRWRRVLLNRIEELIKNRGYDGLLLDTIGNLEKGELIEQYGYELHEAYKKLLHEIKKKYPKILIIQNNGLNTVLEYSQNYIDGLCWENPPICRWESRFWTKYVIQKLISIRKSKADFIVILLEEDYRSKWATRLCAKKYKWLYYKANKDYL